MILPRRALCRSRAVEQHSAVGIDEGIAHRAVELLGKHGRPRVDGFFIKHRCGAMGLGQQLRRGIVLKRDVEDTGNDHREQHNAHQSKSQNAAEDTPREAHGLLQGRHYWPSPWNT